MHGGEPRAHKIFSQKRHGRSCSANEGEWVLRHRLTQLPWRTTINLMVEYSKSLNVVFAAVADPTRRAILAALARKPATVTEIAKPFPVSLNAISKHLMMLERAGLIRRQVVGREHHCSIEPRPLREAAAWIEHYRRFWEDRLDSLERHLVADRRRSHS